MLSEIKIPSRVRRKAPLYSSSLPFSDKVQPFLTILPHFIAEHLFQFLYRCSPYGTYGSDNKFVVAGGWVQILCLESTAVFFYTFYIGVD